VGWEDMQKSSGNGMNASIMFLCGWITKGIGHAYGKGYGPEILAKWMKLL
jgi:hypothetical protein